MPARRQLRETQKRRNDRRLLPDKGRPQSSLAQKRVRAALAEAAAHNLLRHQAFVSMFEVYVEREGVCLVRKGFSHRLHSINTRHAQPSMSPSR